MHSIIVAGIGTNICFSITQCDICEILSLRSQSISLIIKMRKMWFRNEELYSKAVKLVCFQFDVPETLQQRMKKNSRAYDVM